MPSKWPKRIVGYTALICGWLGFTYLVPHEIFSWQFVKMVGVAMCFSMGGGILDCAKLGIWPWEATERRY